MIVEQRSPVPAEAAQVYAWHARPGAFERLVPPWERVRLVEPHPGLVAGSRVVLDVQAGPFRTRWVSRHESVDPDRGFTDVQETGPFARWRHAHRFEPAGRGTCELVDHVDLELPGGPLGEVAEPWVRRKLRRMLRYRHRTVAADLAMHASYPGPRLRVGMTGASGLIGRALASVLTTGGHEVVPLVRRRAGPGEIGWDPERNRLDPESLAGLDAIVHLAAEPIDSARWSSRQRARIQTSRTQGTRLIADAIARAGHPPRVLVSASAIGFYGDRGEALLDEDSVAGVGFLAEVGSAWEAAAAPAKSAGTRTVLARFGIVLTPAGGALPRMQLPFSLGVGGRLGGGQHWMSWIGLDDAVGVILHALMTDRIAGPLNVVAPSPVKNREFAAVLGRVLKRPALLPVPAFALRLLFDGLADEALLASTRVHSSVLSATGYQFRHVELETALRHVLGRMT